MEVPLSSSNLKGEQTRYLKYKLCSDCHKVPIPQEHRCVACRCNILSAIAEDLKRQKSQDSSSSSLVSNNNNNNKSHSLPDSPITKNKFTKSPLSTRRVSSHRINSNNNAGHCTAIEIVAPNQSRSSITKSKERTRWEREIIKNLKRIAQKKTELRAEERCYQQILNVLIITSNCSSSSSSHRVDDRIRTTSLPNIALIKCPNQQVTADQTNVKAPTHEQVDSLLPISTTTTTSSSNDVVPDSDSNRK